MKPRWFVVLAAIAFTIASVVALTLQDEKTPSYSAETSNTDIPAKSSVAPAVVSSPPSPKENTDCLTPAQVESHPMFLDEFERLTPFLAMGADFGSYRSLTRESLQDLARQNDSGAMVVLGRMAELRASGVDEDRAVDFLDVTESVVVSTSGSKLPRAERRVEFLVAADWYYRAALHGRLLALARYGSTVASAGKGPVELGWMTADEYDSLPDRQKPWFSPTSIYHHLPYVLMPELQEGLLDIGFHDRSGESDKWLSLIDRLESDFRSDLNDAGLTLPVLGPTELPDADEVVEMICPQFRDEYFDKD